MATVNQQIDALLKRGKNPIRQTKYKVKRASIGLIRELGFNISERDIVRIKKGALDVGWIVYPPDNEMPRHVLSRADADSLIKALTKNDAAWKKIMSAPRNHTSRKVTLVAATRNPTRADDVPGDFSQSSARVYGRAWIDAKNASVKDVGNDAIVRLTFPDGEWLQMVFDSRAGALKCLKRLGFA